MHRCPFHKLWDCHETHRYHRVYSLMSRGDPMHRCPFHKLWDFNETVRYHRVYSLSRGIMYASLSISPNEREFLKVGVNGPLLRTGRSKPEYPQKNSGRKLWRRSARKCSILWHNYLTFCPKLWVCFLRYCGVSTWWNRSHQPLQAQIGESTNGK